MEKMSICALVKIMKRFQVYVDFYSISSVITRQLYDTLELERNSSKLKFTKEFVAASRVINYVPIIMEISRKVKHAIKT